MQKRIFLFLFLSVFFNSNFTQQLCINRDWITNSGNIGDIGQDSNALDNQANIYQFSNVKNGTTSALHLEKIKNSGVIEDVHHTHKIIK
ncbi:MAG: hypothetical protein HYU67_01550 [Flavobacteriia bacterium]|nr:hypothetical protein [Flavobacteriia bacterium]